MFNSQPWQLSFISFPWKQCLLACQSPTSHSTGERAAVSGQEGEETYLCWCKGFSQGRKLRRPESFLMCSAFPNFPMGVFLDIRTRCWQWQCVQLKTMGMWLPQDSSPCIGVGHHRRTIFGFWAGYEVVSTSLSASNMWLWDCDGVPGLISQAKKSSWILEWESSNSPCPFFSKKIPIDHRPSPDWL